MDLSEPWPKRVPTEHVHLSYAYLNARDYDAFVSLLDEDVTVRGPDGTSVCGREAVVAAEQRRRRTYVLEDLWSTAGRVVATEILPLSGAGCPEWVWCPS